MGRMVWGRFGSLLKEELHHGRGGTGLVLLDVLDNGDQGIDAFLEIDLQALEVLAQVPKGVDLVLDKEVHHSLQGLGMGVFQFLGEFPEPVDGLHPELDTCENDGHSGFLVLDGTVIFPVYGASEGPLSQRFDFLYWKGTTPGSAKALKYNRYQRISGPTTSR